MPEMSGEAAVRYAPAPPTDREKLIAEAESTVSKLGDLDDEQFAMSREGITRLVRKLAGGLAAPDPLDVDEEKLAEVIGDAMTNYMRKHSDWNCGELGYPGSMKRFIARAIREEHKEGKLHADR